MKQLLMVKTACFLLMAAAVFPVSLLAQNSEQQGTEQATGEELNEEELTINDGENPSVALEEGMSGFSFWDFLRMILVLGAVIALIYALFLFLKRIGTPKGGGEELIQLLSTKPLHGSRALHLVKIGTEVFLVGSADGSVSLVSKIEEKESLDQIALRESEQAGGSSSFTASLRGLLGDTGNAITREETNFLRKQKDRLKKI